MGDRAHRLFDDLEIGRGDTVILHTAFGRLRSYFSSPEDLLGGLMDRLGSAGTLITPRYGWHLLPDARPWQGYAEFIRTRPKIDLRFTAANIGAVPESFRKRDDVVTSLSYFWPVVACGRLAQELTANQERLGHSYEDESVFGRLLEQNARIVGLGVTLNTTSIAPVTDWKLGAAHHGQIFTTHGIMGVVVGPKGDRHEISAITMKAEAVRDMKPSRVLESHLKPGVDYPYLFEQGNIYFSYRAKQYHEIAMSLGRDALICGRAVPWFDNGSVKEGE